MLDGWEEKHQGPSQFDAQCHEVGEVQLVAHQEKHPQSPITNQEQHVAAMKVNH